MVRPDPQVGDVAADDEAVTTWGGVVEAELVSAAVEGAVAVATGWGGLGCLEQPTTKAVRTTGART